MSSKKEQPVKSRIVLVLIGPWPGGALPTQQSTWGKIKAKFGSKDGQQ